MKHIILSLLLLASFVSFAATNAPAPPPANGPEPPADTPILAKAYGNFTGLFARGPVPQEAYYRKNTLDLNLSATYTARGGSDFGALWTSEFNRGRWGINVGSMVWISRYFGTGVEAGISDITNPGNFLFDYAAINTAVRVPMGRFCPYVVAGAGRNFDESGYFVGVGPGISFAITDRTKLFIDSRFTWQEQTYNNVLLTRAGITFTF